MDIGSSSIKIVRLKAKKVVLAAFMDIPEGGGEDEDHFVRTLSGFVKGLRIEGMSACIQIPAGEAFIRTINFPPMPQAELREALRWEVKRCIPFPMEESVYDYVSVDMPEGIAVTFASAEKKVIEKHIEPIKASGLKIVAVDIGPLCLLRSVRPKTPGNAVILDIGAFYTEISIVKAGVLKITRSIEMGGGFIKKHLQEGGLTKEEAEGVLFGGTEEQLIGALGEFLKETSRSMDYYRVNFKEKNFSEIVLTGGVSINPAVKGCFSGTFNMPVSVPDPFEGFTMEDESIRALGPRFSVSLGLAGRQA
jgi:type IV pilus assembly protein PilM